MPRSAGVSETLVLPARERPRAMNGRGRGMYDQFETHHEILKPQKTWQEQVMSVTTTVVIVLLALSGAVFAL